MSNTINKTELEMYQKDVGFFLNDIYPLQGWSESQNVAAETNNLLQVTKLKVRGLSDELEQEIIDNINKAILISLNNLEEFKRGSVNHIQTAEALNISLIDYIEYVLKQ